MGDEWLSATFLRLVGVQGAQTEFLRLPAAGVALVFLGAVSRLGAALRLLAAALVVFLAVALLFSRARVLVSGALVLFSGAVEGAGGWVMGAGGWVMGLCGHLCSVLTGTTAPSSWLGGGMEASGLPTKDCSSELTETDPAVVISAGAGGAGGVFGTGGVFCSRWSPLAMMDLSFLRSLLPRLICSRIKDIIMPAVGAPLEGMECCEAEV